MQMRFARLQQLDWVRVDWSSGGHFVLDADVLFNSGDALEGAVDVKYTKAVISIDQIRVPPEIKKKGEPRG